jgi:hypothetical protein
MFASHFGPTIVICAPDTADLFSLFTFDTGHFTAREQDGSHFNAGPTYAAQARNRSAKQGAF